MNSDKQKLDALIEKLIGLGDTAEELRYIQSIFEDFKEEEKEAMLKNLEGELAELGKVV